MNGGTFGNETQFLSFDTMALKQGREKRDFDTRTIIITRKRDHPKIDMRKSIKKDTRKLFDKF
jgi:hypothetical protein